MVERVRLGLVFKYDDTWIAGSYYILNLICALKTLPDSQKPHIVLFTDSTNDRERVIAIEYPYMSHKQYNPQLSFFEKLLNKVFRFVLHKNMVEKRVQNSDVDYFLMLRRSWETDLLDNTRKLFWIPDCQELVMPQLFFKRELDGRKHVYNEIVTAKSNILFSSFSTLNTFKSFYPQAVNAMFVAHFSVTHPDFSQINFETLKEKYNIKHQFFMAPNQFWQHKNHQIILEAVLLLKNATQKFQILFTGKENDFRAPEYTIQLKDFVKRNKLESMVSFLGFIPRNEQLCLIKNSVAVIQPSLFEGWSTVVEDAKALNKQIILSSIEVHQEQISKNVCFFKPDNAQELSEIIKNGLIDDYNPEFIDYNQNIKQFALDFIKSIDKK